MLTTTRTILCMFVLIWIHFSYWIQMWQIDEKLYLFVKFERKKKNPVVWIWNLRREGWSWLKLWQGSHNYLTIVDQITSLLLKLPALFLPPVLFDKLHRKQSNSWSQWLVHLSLKESKASSQDSMNQIGN